MSNETLTRCTNQSGQSSTNTSDDPAQNQSSPYYLHPSENPNVVLVSRPLTEQNYHQLARSMKLLWDELDNYRPLPTCSCTVKCTCDALVNVEKYRTQDRVIRFLKGLNDCYSTVKSQIMIMDPFPALSILFSLVVQQERQLIGGETEPKLIATIGRGNGFGRGRGTGRFNKNFAGRGANNGKVCSYCERTGHPIDTCYRKHGFPPNFKFTKPGLQGSINSVCSDMNNEKEEPDSRIASLKDEQDGSIFSLTAEQYKGLLSLLQQSQSQIASHSTNHVSTIMSSTAGVSSGQQEPGESFNEADWYN